MIRKSKMEGELLNWEDYKKMEFTQNVRSYEPIKFQEITSNILILFFLKCGIVDTR